MHLQCIERIENAAEAANAIAGAHTYRGEACAYWTAEQQTRRKESGRKVEQKTN